MSHPDARRPNGDHRDEAAYGEVLETSGANLRAIKTGAPLGKGTGSRVRFTLVVGKLSSPTLKRGGRIIAVGMLGYWITKFNKGQPRASGHLSRTHGRASWAARLQQDGDPRSLATVPALEHFTIRLTISGVG